jgi:general secretion pathway protein A
MYNNHFGLTKLPFNLTADPGFLYLTEDHREALAALVYAIRSRKGFVVLASEAGMGKTTLLRTVLERFHDDIRSSLIFNPSLTPNEFLETALIDFGCEDVPPSKALRVNRLQRMLLMALHQGKNSVLFIDEAHKLSPEVLEEIRLLSNFETAEQKLLQIVLCGQPELMVTLDRPDLWQLKQRISSWIAIRPLAPADVDRYIQHRWTVAGGSSPAPFEERAIERIAHSSKGIPRLMNVICDHALTLAFADGARLVTVDHVVEACKELRLNGSVERLLKKQPAPTPISVLPVEPLAVPVYSGMTLRTLERIESAGKQPSRWTRWFRKPIQEATTENV